MHQSISLLDLRLHAKGQPEERRPCNRRSGCKHLVYVFLLVLYCHCAQYFLAHPTLNRHSPPEVVANFKRRVPPRLPKPRKRDTQESLSIPPTSLSYWHGPGTLVCSPVSQSWSYGSCSWLLCTRFLHASLAETVQPLLPAAGTVKTTTGLHCRLLLFLLTHRLICRKVACTVMRPRTTLVTILSAPAADEPPFAYGNTNPYPSSYQEPQNSNWFPPVNNGSSSHNGSLSSLLNPSSNGGYSRPTPRLIPRIRRLSHPCRCRPSTLPRLFLRIVTAGPRPDTQCLQFLQCLIKMNTIPTLVPVQATITIDQ